MSSYNNNTGRNYQSSSNGNRGAIRGYAASSRQQPRQPSYQQQPRQQQDEEEEEDGIDMIKERITQVKKDTLESTRNSLRTLEQTERVGANTLTKLGEQTEQLNRIDRTLEMTSIQAENSVEHTSKLQTLSKSIFHVHVKNPFANRKRREMELAKLQAEQERARKVEDRKTQNIQESRRRVQQYANQDGRPGGSRGPAGRMDAQGNIVSQGGSSRGRDRDRYTFEDEDPEVEDEIDDNVDQMSAALGRLKGLSLATRDELEAQKAPMRRIHDNTDKTSDNIGMANYHLNRIK